MEIGVPTRFSTPRADIDVVTRAARAPALLTAYRMKGGDNQSVDLHLQTGVRTSTRNTFASVCEGPFEVVNQEDAADSTVILASAPDTQYFLHSYHIAANNLAAGTGIRHGFIFATPGSSNCIVKLYGTASVVGNYVADGVLDVLTKRNTNVYIESSGAWTHTIITLTYSVASGVM